MELLKAQLETEGAVSGNINSMGTNTMLGITATPESNDYRSLIQNYKRAEELKVRVHKQYEDTLKQEGLLEFGKNLYLKDTMGLKISIMHFSVIFAFIFGVAMFLWDFQFSTSIITKLTLHSTVTGVLNMLFLLTLIGVLLFKKFYIDSVNSVISKDGMLSLISSSME